MPHLGRPLNENHVVLRALTLIVEYCKAHAFAQSSNLSRIYPVLRRRTVFAWALRVELRHHSERSWQKQSNNAA